MEALIDYTVKYIHISTLFQKYSCDSTQPQKILLQPERACYCDKYIKQFMETCDDDYANSFLTLSKKTSTPFGHPSVRASDSDFTVL